MPTIEEEIATKFEWSDKNVQKRLSQMERQVVDTYLKAYADIRSQVNVLYEKMKFKPDLYTASQYGRLKNIEMQIASILKQTGKKMNGNTESFIKEQFAERYYEAGYALESSLQMHLRFGLLNPKVITASVINPYDRIGWKKRTDMTNEQLNNIVRQSLTDSIIKGESYQTATAIIKSKIGQVVSNNIMRIVRTEGQRAMNWGNLTALSQAQTYAREAGIEFLKVWSATIDKRTRDSHRSMDGRHEEKTPEGGFILPSGVWTQAPSMSGVAEEDINCRCTLISQVDGMTPKFRRVRDEKGKSQVIPNQSYHQYFNARVKTQTSPISKPVTLKTKPAKPKAKPKPITDADKFVKDSVFKEDFYHTTNAENVASIEKDGFDLSKTGFGRVWGDGVYLSKDRSTAKFYEDRVKGNVSTLVVKVNVKKPFRINLDDIDPEMGYWTTVQNKLEQVEKGISKRIKELESKYFKINEDNFKNAPFREKGTNLTPEEIKIRGDYFEKLRREGKTIYNEKAKAITDAMQERGFDAFEIIDSRIRSEFGESQLLVFDPKNVLIVKP